MPARYAALPNDAPDDELEAAFESDDDEPNTAHVGTITHADAAAPTSPPPVPGSYDFERVYEYDRPPPGSPPRPSALALPNQIGNSNGLLPAGPIARPTLAAGPMRRALAALFPSRYTRVPTAERSMGAGIDNDGVFANVTAKPTAPRVRPERGDDGIYVVPEDVQKEAPPSYAVAQADAVPPYWETTVHAPASASIGEMVVDGMQTGTLFSFLWNMLISLSFSFVGFLLTYLLHTTHAAKFGSRAGLGITLLQYGFTLRSQGRLAGAGGAGAGGDDSQDVWPGDLLAPNGTEPAGDETLEIVIPYTQEWVAFLFMTFGWFLLLTSLLGYWRVKRWEAQIRRSAAAPTPTADELAHDAGVRRNLVRLFGLTAASASDEREWDLEQGEETHSEPASGPPLSADEIRLRNDLRAAGLL